MDFSSRFSAMQQQVAEVARSVQEAGRESRDQLKRRIEQAQSGRDQGITGTSKAREQGSKWDQMRADAAAKSNEIKARIDQRTQAMDADMAAADADLAEADADGAIDDAMWTLDNARLAVLDAIDARANAEARAGGVTA